MFDLNDNSNDSWQFVVSEEGQSRTVRRGGQWILVFNTDTLDSDVIGNLKKLTANLDLEDIRYLDFLLLIRGKKSVKVDSNLAEDLVGDRTKSPVIINNMKEELNRDFGYKLYDRGPHKRLAVRLPLIEIKDFTDTYTRKIKDIILNETDLTPHNITDILSVYLIADETYVRLEPGLFFGEIFDLKTEPEKKAKEPEQSGKIILGESPQELVELALKKLQGYKVYRDIEFVEAAGLAYSFGAFAALENDRILIKYLDTVTEDDLMEMTLFMDAFGAQRGWILTREQEEIELQTMIHETDNISILTIKDL